MTQSRYELLVGLEVTDPDQYDQYRQKMMPLLEQHGGRFEYDFTIQSELKTQAEHPINRLFILSFPDEQDRQTYFRPSVGGATIIRTWNTEA